MQETDAQQMAPEEIERRSFDIISEELRSRGIALDEETAPVVKRVIHTTADFEYADTLRFSKEAMAGALTALREGCPIITDTQMARSGINGGALRDVGGATHCYIGDEDVAKAARTGGGTRSRAAVEKAAKLWSKGIYVVGNAPTALIRICELVKENRLRPRLVVGVPVGFVNVVESKEMLMKTGVPYIVAVGRKGGSTVAAAICNALLYMIVRK